MSQTITVKRKTINFKDSNQFIEDEVFPETILFEITEADTIHDLNNLVWFMQYHRSISDNGIDSLTVVSVTDNVLTLEWHPSAGFTLNKGNVKVQIVGVKVVGSAYTTRWSTIATTINLPENIITNQLSPVITPDWLTNFLNQLNQIKTATEGFKDDAEEAKEAIENMTVSSETLPAGSSATITKTIGDVVNLHFGLPTGAGVPTGGTTGQVLKKQSNSDYDYMWDTGAEPLAYIKSVSVSGSTLTFTKKDNTTVVFTVTHPTNLSSFTDDLGTTPIHSHSQYALNSDLNSHTGNVSNPHSVTKAQIGLGNVPNTDFTSTISSIQNNVDTIEGKIPVQASSSNQLADKEFVNSSISTETAHYISDNGQPFTDPSNLPTQGVTNNDYAYVTGTDSVGNTYFDKYKATVPKPSSASSIWAKEYRLNNSSFTASQWASITSGITSSKVNTYDGYATSKADVSDLPTTLAELSDDTTHRLVTDTEKSTWNNKSVVSVSESGTSSDKVNYITINGTEKKLGGTEVSVSPTGSATDTVNYITINGTEKKIGGKDYSAGNGISINGTVITNSAPSLIDTVKVNNVPLVPVDKTVNIETPSGIYYGTSTPSQGETVWIDPSGTASALEYTTNKVTSLSASSTDTQYPSAKCVYDIIGNIETLLASI